MYIQYTCTCTCTLKTQVGIWKTQQLPGSRYTQMSRHMISIHVQVYLEFHQRNLLLYFDLCWFDLKGGVLSGSCACVLCEVVSSGLGEGEWENGGGS